MIFLDTHVLVWFNEGSSSRLTRTARRAIEADGVAASPMAIFELDLLHEIGRISHGGRATLDFLGPSLGLVVAAIHFDEVTAAAASLTWTRDPFDRLIVAHASAGGNGLVTKDRTIRGHYPHAIWD